MKGHDLGKDCLASGSAYRAVSSRETLPGPEGNYELSKVQVSPSYATFELFQIFDCKSNV